MDEELARAAKESEVFKRPSAATEPSPVLRRPSGPPPSYAAKTDPIVELKCDIQVYARFDRFSST